MKTIKQVKIKYKLVDTIPDDLEENILYVSNKFSTVIHKCLCGCKNEVVTPINPHGWNLSIHNDKLTLTPSIGNYQFDCRSHYIITKSIANFV